MLYVIMTLLKNVCKRPLFYITPEKGEVLLIVILFCNIFFFNKKVIQATLVTFTYLFCYVNHIYKCYFHREVISL